MINKRNILGEALLVILFLLTCYEGFFIFKSAVIHYKSFISFMVGMGVYLLVSRFDFVNKNAKFLQTMSHEWSHTVVALLFFRKMYSFKAESRGTGEITHDGSNIFISLAPYCLPLVTYILLIFRCFVAAKLYWLFDGIVGFSLAFHIHCIKTQIGNYQTDINKRPLYLSYSFISTFCLFNLCVIVCSILPSRASGYHKSFDVYGAFQYLGTQFWKDICNLFT